MRGAHSQARTWQTLFHSLHQQILYNQGTFISIHKKLHTHVRLYWRRVMSEMCRAPSSLNLTTPCWYENTCYTLHISYPPFEFLTETPTNSVANNSCFIRQPRYEFEKLKTPRLTSPFIFTPHLSGTMSASKLPLLDVSTWCRASASVHTESYVRGARNE